jgi:hypothetical protein
MDRGAAGDRDEARLRHPAEFVVRGMLVALGPRRRAVSPSKLDGWPRKSHYLDLLNALRPDGAYRSNSKSLRGLSGDRIVMTDLPRRESELFLYTAPGSAVKVGVLFRDDTAWLTQTEGQKALAELFGVKVPAINKHLKNIFE